MIFLKYDLKSTPFGFLATIEVVILLKKLTETTTFLAAKAPTGFGLKQKEKLTAAL